MDAVRKPIDHPEGDTMMAPRDPWVHLAEAAKIRGKHRMTVLLEALDGKVRNQKVAGRRVFHRDDLEKLRRERDGHSPTDADAGDSHGNE